MKILKELCEFKTICNGYRENSSTCNEVSEKQQCGFYADYCRDIETLCDFSNICNDYGKNKSICNKMCVKRSCKRYVRFNKKLVKIMERMKIKQILYRSGKQANICWIRSQYE